jgi:hypothetical protein
VPASWTLPLPLWRIHFWALVFASEKASLHPFCNVVYSPSTVAGVHLDGGAVGLDIALDVKTHVRVAVGVKGHGARGRRGGGCSGSRSGGSGGEARGRRHGREDGKVDHGGQHVAELERRTGVLGQGSRRERWMGCSKVGHGGRVLLLYICARRLWCVCLCPSVGPFVVLLVVCTFRAKHCRVRQSATAVRASCASRAGENLNI